MLCAIGMAAFTGWAKKAAIPDTTTLRSFVKMLRCCMTDDEASFVESVKKLVKNKPVPEKPE